MKKRLISFMVAVVMLFSMLCPAVYADNKAVSFDTCTHEWETPLRSGYSITIPGTDVSLSVKTEQCTKCKWYKHIAIIFIAEFTYYSPLNVDANGLVPAELATYWANVWYNTFGKNATASQWTAGGGSTDGSGVGRHPSGYADDNGTPSVSNEGSNIYKLEPYYWVEGYFKLTNGKTSNRDVDYYPIACPYWDYSDHVIDVNEYPDLSFSGNTLSFVNSRTYYSYGVVYGMSAPVAGLYKIYKKPSVASWSNTYTSGSLSYNAIGYFSNKNFSSEYVKAGTSLYWQFGHYYGNNSSGNLKISASELYVSCIPSQTTINQQTNITINNNTWNGNIYVDSSTNLTYIYPEYTTINENNETVTNISNNPIIYNNETKQYYTYDQTTKNYYYIYYGSDSPTPTPSPEPSPSPTPDPSQPTPAPTPGGDTGDTTGILAVLVDIRDNMIQGFLDIKAALVQGWADLSANFTLAIENLTINIQNFFSKGMSGSPVDPNIPGGGSGTISTPETGGKDDSGGSGWSWNPLKWLSDLLKDIVEGIIKAIWKLITALFGFLLWLLSLVGSLFPFIPGQAVLAVTSAVVIVAVIRIIKFITGR